MLIEFSGIDGAGKTTQVDRLQRLANDSGVECHVRTLSTTFRRILGRIGDAEGVAAWRDLFDPAAVELATALELYQQAYATIVPIWQPGQLIVTETYARYWLASAEMNLTEPSWAVEAVYRLFPAPDLAVHLSVDPQTSFDRIVARRKADHVLREGGVVVLESLCRGYELADRVLEYAPAIVDASREPDEVERAVADALGAVRPSLAQRDQALLAPLVDRL